MGSKAGKSENQAGEEEVRNQEEGNGQAGDGGERIQLEAMGWLLNGENRNQVTILNHYIKANKIRKRKMSLMMTAAMVFLTISMMLGVYIFTRTVLCSDLTSGHQDLTKSLQSPGPINKDSAPVSISQDPVYSIQFPAPNNKDSAPRLQPTRWGKFLQKIYLQEQRTPLTEIKDLVGDQGAEKTLSQKPWMDLQPLPQDTTKDSEEPYSDQTPQETTLPTQLQDFQKGWLE